MRKPKTNSQTRKRIQDPGAKPNGADDTTLSAGASAQPRASVNERDWPQVTFRAPRKAKTFVDVLCAEHGVTLQTLGLRWLQSLGAPISDADLNDHRKKKMTRHHTTSAPAREKTDAGREAPDIRARAPTLDQQMLKDVAQLANGHEGALVIQVFFLNGATGIQSSG